MMAPAWDDGCALPPVTIARSPCQHPRGTYGDTAITREARCDAARLRQSRRSLRAGGRVDAAGRVELLATRARASARRRPARNRRRLEQRRRASVRTRAT